MSMLAVPSEGSSPLRLYIDSLGIHQGFTRNSLLSAVIGDGWRELRPITYDPEYDLPARLKAYGESRGVAFGDDHRIFRTRVGFRDLQEYFQLGVNFTGSTVNRHRIELFVLDSQGEIAATFTRLQWDIQEVLEQARALL